MVVTVGLAVFAGTACSSEAAFYEVSQPFFQPNGGLEVHRVTYLAWVGSVQPGAEITYISSPNCVLQRDGLPVEPGSRKNQNVASLLSVKLTVEDRSDSRTWMRIQTQPVPSSPSRQLPSFCIDTLRIDVDLSLTVKALAEERKRPSDLGDMVTIGRLSDALVSCIRENASRSKPPIRFVRIRFHGAADAGMHSGVYRVASR
jgi:hypothetical protein